LTAVVCFVVSPANCPSKTTVLYQAAGKLHLSSWGLSFLLWGTLNLVREGRDSVMHLLSQHILYFYTRSGDLHSQPSGHKTEFLSLFPIKCVLCVCAYVHVHTHFHLEAISCVFPVAEHRSVWCGSSKL